MNRNDDVVATLRTLDPADRHVDPTTARARADLQAILATDPTPHGRQLPSSPSTAADRPRRPVRTVRRVVLAAGMVAAVTAGLVVLPSLTGGDHAFATWTATPAGMSAQEQAEAVTDCRGQTHAGDYATALRSADPVVAERRGVWTTVVLAGADGFSAMCITDSTAGLFTSGMIGSIGTPADYAAPKPRELVATDLGTGTMSAGDISLIAGAAGSDVVGVVYRSRTHGDVTATVNGGHFALWFPGDELMNASNDGVELDVTYRDGTTTTSRLTLR